MDSIRKWFYKPKKGDRSLLAQFFYADEALNLVAAELDSFDGRKDPERCTALVNHLRQCQDKVLTICNRIMDDVIPFERADRDFRVKFPDDVMQENLAGQLWFGAECLAAGSSIMNREAESANMRPLAKAVTKALENVRNQLRDHCLRSVSVSAEQERLAESLKILDRLFAEFEICYVSAMVPVKSSHEYELQQLVVVLFSETLQRALSMRLLAQEMVDSYDPALMFTIPRLAIVSGLLVFPDCPLCVDRPSSDMSEMFRPFRTLLAKIRELLWTLTARELYQLELMLCSGEEVEGYAGPGEGKPDLEDFVTRFYTDYPQCKDLYAPAGPSDLGSESDSSESSDTLVTSHHPPPPLPTPPLPPPPSPPPADEQLMHTDACGPSPSASPAVARSGFLLANKLAPREDRPSPPPPGSCAESLPDGDATQVMSNATATLTTLLHRSPRGAHVSDQVPGGPGRSYAGNWDSLVRQQAQSAPRKQRRARRRLHAENEANNSGYSSTCSSCQSSLDPSESSSDTSSFNSECQDDREIALALQAAEIATRTQTRAKFRSSEDLVHRLFVCVAGVADQLQTNFAGDLRHILKSVFQINNSTEEEMEETEEDLEEEMEDQNADANNDLCRTVDAAEEALGWETPSPPSPTQGGEVEAPPPWVPDDHAPRCMSCDSGFTVVRRRHHCRNCGKVFCSRCSSNTVALPRYGHSKPVRVCNRCFIYQVTPFTIDQIAAHS